MDVTAFANDLTLAYRSYSKIVLICDLIFDISLLREWFVKHFLRIKSKPKIMFPFFTQQEFTDIKIINHDHSSLRFIRFNLNCEGITISYSLMTYFVLRTASKLR